MIISHSEEIVSAVVKAVRVENISRTVRFRADGDPVLCEMGTGGSLPLVVAKDKAYPSCVSKAR